MTCLVLSCEEVPQGYDLCLTLLEIALLKVLRLLYLVVQ